MPKIYNYDPTTGAFLTESEARLDPIDNEPMVPANATLVELPQSGVNQVATWSDVDEGWTLKPDFRGAEYWLADGTHHTILKIGEVPPEDALDAEPTMPREDQRKVAMSRVDEAHSDYLVMLTGGATVAERDTWKVKEEAARALEAGAATPGQIAMLEAEADGSGITKEVLAATILAKADGFLVLIGVAAGIRAESRAAVIAATDEAVPLAEVSDRIDQVDAAMREKAEAAAAAILAGN